MGYCYCPLITNELIATITYIPSLIGASSDLLISAGFLEVRISLAAQWAAGRRQQVYNVCINIRYICSTSLWNCAFFDHVDVVWDENRRQHYSTAKGNLGSLRGCRGGLERARGRLFPVLSFPKFFSATQCYSALHLATYILFLFYLTIICYTALQNVLSVLVCMV